jgi:hypothetical protein
MSDDYTVKIVLPTRRLLEGAPYVPSWLMPVPRRFTVPRLNGRFGLQTPQVPEGSASERDLDEAANPSTAG